MKLIIEIVVKIHRDGQQDPETKTRKKRKEEEKHFGNVDRKEEAKDKSYKNRFICRI